MRISDVLPRRDVVEFRRLNRSQRFTGSRAKRIVDTFRQGARLS